MPLQIEVSEHEHGIVVCAVHGDVDMGSSAQVRQHLVPLIKPGRKAVIIDLSQVPYMDSSGIATMVEGLQQSMKLGMHFRLAALSPTVMEVFKLARLESVFRIYPTIADAVHDL